ncbi:MAG: hypothetical protein FWE24_08935 [Defluviitaleaceae bacterium]|nr:hypothetical protein [Defluviitaleaceae bacterium]
MKSKRHIKFAIAISAAILLSAVLTACTVGMGSSQTPEEADTAGDSPRTAADFANLYIESLTEGLTVGIFAIGDRDNPIDIRPANIIDRRINILEKEAEFDNIIPDTIIELWRLDFMVQTDDLESETLRWGTFFPDSEGWIGHHSAWNDASTLLVFSHEMDDTAYNITFLGSIPWWMEETPEGLAGALRTFLESEGLIESAGVFHQFDNLGFSIVFPAFWEGKYGLDEFSVEFDFGTRHFVEVYHTATREEMFEESGFPYGGRILSLAMSPREGYTYEHPPIMAGGTIFLAQTGGNTYFVNFPSGVEHNEDPNSQSVMEYLEMVGHWEPSHWDFLTNSFRLIEGWESAGALLQIIPPGVLTLINALEPGMVRDTAESLFAPTVMPNRVIRAYDGGYSYRYDLISDADYVFESPHGIDDVDIEGLQEGRVRLVVFIDYTAQNTISSHTVYYSIWDGSVYEFRTFSDGNIRHTRIMDGGDWNHDDSLLWN